MSTQKELTPQHELTGGPLHDARGHLTEAGYATAERKTYRRDAIKAPWYRIKEWDYYGIFGEEFGLACVIADNSYMGLISATWLDFKKPAHTSQAAIPLLTRGRLKMPESADRGDVAASHKGVSLDFRHVPGGRRLLIDCPAFDGGPGGGKGLKGDLFLEQPEMDRMVIATPFCEDDRLYYYNQKINCMPATGEVTVAGTTYAFSPDTHMGVLDWGRGCWAYNNTWFWGSASGRVDGRPFGFNIGYGFGDTSAASENMVFVDGRAHKLDQVVFHIPEAGFTSGPWRFSSNDGRFEMDFEPVLDRHGHTDIGFLRSIEHQVFGKFSGTVVLDDGTQMKVENLFGFAEDVRTRW